MAEPSDDVFVAEDSGPPRRRFWICREEPQPGGGWSFIYEATSEGDWGVGGDTWEEWFFEIMRYPSEYASRPLVWRRESTNEIVTLEELQPLYDGKVASPDETPEQAGLTSN